VVGRPEVPESHAELAPEFELARAVIQARTHAGLTQEQLARRMETTQSVIARLESGRVQPSTQTLTRLAAATGTRLRISFELTGAER
jgi:transcriptional regulator with XRE-family HTH domain